MLHHNSGDNPSCTDGPPVTLDWAFDPTTQFVLDLNTFEEMRGPRRVHKEMLMPRSVREKRYVFFLETKSHRFVVVLYMGTTFFGDTVPLDYRSNP